MPAPLMDMADVTMIQAELSTPAHVAPSGRWHSPRSYVGTLTLFVVGYLVWQPVAAFFLPRLLGSPRLEGSSAWQAFMLILPPLAVIGGTLWWAGGLRGPGAIRYWLRGTSRYLPLSTMLSAARIGTMPIATWLAVTLVTAALMGLTFGWMERWDTPTHRARST
jgi:hypothetical protein